MPHCQLIPRLPLPPRNPSYTLRPSPPTTRAPSRQLHPEHNSEASTQPSCLVIATYLCTPHAASDTHTSCSILERKGRLHQGLLNNGWRPPTLRTSSESRAASGGRESGSDSGHRADLGHLLRQGRNSVRQMTPPDTAEDLAIFYFLGDVGLREEGSRLWVLVLQKRMCGLK
ncbi:hypothetical protein E2C01_020174 [Portunus trituberculatus]|uniref:Uncharacterized protein n=1 Tax=Portunus trituberculatus TaxID=210409 RepID=A0A5B7DZ42_PORTR|nr:hypothetical protein [Portunus trituberculatus]